MPNLASYQDVLLFFPEATVLRALEQQLGEVIPYRTTDDMISGFIAENNHIITLKLFNQGLRALPENFDQLSKLQTLKLTANSLKSLPESLLQLTGLQSLSLGMNQLRTLPESLNHLSNLQELYLGENQLRCLPESFGNLTNLGRLDLRFNQLKTLPESLGNLSNLQTLRLTGNQLRTLPESFGDLTNLIYLQLNDNQLRTLPESFGSLRSLQELYLQRNQLSSLPDSFRSLINSQTNLRILNFEHNPLAGMLALLWLGQTRSNFLQSWIPASLFTHPLVQDLEPSSLRPFSRNWCPFCGTVGLVGGQEKPSGRKRVFCVRCELRIS